MRSKKKEIKNMMNKYSLNGADFETQKSVLETHYEEFNKNLQSKIEREEGSFMPLIFYCGVGHKKMNSVCREYLTSNNSVENQRIFDNYITPLEEMIRDAPKIPTTINLFRFIDEYEFKILKKCYRKGTEYMREGFTSCTISTEMPNTLIEQNISEKYMMYITVPEGTSAIYLRDTIPYIAHGEREIIVQRMCKIRVMDIVKVDVNHTVLICELINTL